MCLCGLYIFYSAKKLRCPNGQRSVIRLNIYTLMN